MPPVFYCRGIFLMIANFLSAQSGGPSFDYSRRLRGSFRSGFTATVIAGRPSTTLRGAEGPELRRGALDALRRRRPVEDAGRSSR